MTVVAAVWMDGWMDGMNEDCEGMRWPNGTNDLAHNAMLGCGPPKRPGQRAEGREHHHSMLGRAGRRQNGLGRGLRGKQEESKTHPRGRPRVPCR